MNPYTTTDIVLASGAQAPDSPAASGALLTTKLSVPRSRATLIPRPRLLAQLEHSLGRGNSLTLLSAPAGSGKTSLVAAWLGERQNDESGRMKSAEIPSSSFILHPSSFAWLSLDREDNQPARFLTYLIAALQSIDPGLCQDLPRALAGVAEPAIHVVLSAALNGIAAQSRPIILVLDDYQAIASPAIHEGLAFLLDHAPPQLHIVLCSRTDPPLPIVRLRARDQLSELHVGDLRFTIDESATFLGATTGVSWRPEEVLALHSCTEGWIAGLRIAAQELRKLLAVSPTLHTWREILLFVRGFSGNHRDVRDFLEQEVLAEQPERVQAFLTATSILERMSAPLCDAVLGERGSQAILEELDRHNVFVEPLDTERRWYRYHSMLADVLRARLAHARPNLAPVLHRRAADWYEQHGYEAEALGHRLRTAQAEAANPPDRRRPRSHPLDVTDTNQRVFWLPRDTGGRPASRGNLAELPESGRPQPSVLVQPKPASVGLVEQLTERELDILRLMADGLTYAEISRQLVIGLNTVRFHVKNIYGKLDAHQRAQALARARALHLLP